MRERHDETVACPNHHTIVSAPPPAAIVERGKLGDTLIVEAVADKCIEHQPIERQATRFARAGAPIAPQTLGRGVTAALDLLMPVANMIAELTRGPGPGLLGTDSTGCRRLTNASAVTCCALPSRTMPCSAPTTGKFASNSKSPTSTEPPTRR